MTHKQLCIQLVARLSIMQEFLLHDAACLVIQVPVRTRQVLYHTHLSIDACPSVALIETTSIAERYEVVWSRLRGCEMLVWMVV